MTVVIIGAGQGGYQIAASLREEKFDGRVVLVGDEPGLPYQRPPLSKTYLSGKAATEHVRLRPERFYSDQDIELHMGTRAVMVDRAGRQVLLASGEVLLYQHLVLATGARNRVLPVPGADLDGIFQLRSLGDAEALRQRLDGASRAVVIGAGFIGLEFAACAAQRGLDVTVIEASDRLMSRAVSPRVSAFFQSHHEQQGTRFLLGTTVARIVGEDGRVAGVLTADAQLVPADLVVVGIGVIPDTELAARADLAVANGVIVDDHLLTCDRDISAIGDCVAFPCRYAARAEGGAVGVSRVESVQNAVDQARCVAARIVGRPAPYTGLPWFWSDQGSLRLQIAGLTRPGDTSVLRPSPGRNGSSDGFSVFRFDSEGLTGVESVNRPADHVLARKLLKGSLALTAEQVANPGFDLRGALGESPLSKVSTVAHTHAATYRV